MKQHTKDFDGSRILEQGTQAMEGRLADLERAGLVRALRRRLDPGIAIVGRTDLWMIAQERHRMIEIVQEGCSKLG